MTPTSSTDTPSDEFIIDDGRQRKSAPDRSRAVQMAKNLSRDRDRPVLVERRDGRLKMEFRAGRMTRFRSQR